ncbi:hemerythrin domain-containing protein [Paenibacillus ginsengarvi]|nr:hemerythrin domain-containing protein [Paenibacillus ginsengarvi]
MNIAGNNKGVIYAHKRYDLYGPVHKGLRHALGGICFRTGSADIADHQRLEAILAEWKRIVIILEAHSRDEDLHLDEVYMKYAPETAKQLEVEHEMLDGKIKEINKIVDKIQCPTTSVEECHRLWYMLSRSLDSFTSEYLIHLQREEGPGMEALWGNLDDEQIHELSVKIRSSIPPQAMMILLYYMLPAVTHADRFVIVSDMKRFAPREFYEGVLRLAESRLDPQSFSKLKSAVDRNSMES